MTNRSPSTDRRRKQSGVSSGKADAIWRKPKQRCASNRDRGVKIFQRSWKGSDVIRTPLYPHAVEFSHRWEENYWYATTYSQHMLVVFLPEGKLRYRCDNRPFLISGRRILLIPPGKAYRFETVAGGSPYRKYVLFISGVNLPGILETMGFERPAMLELPETETVTRYFHDLYDMLDSPERSRIPALSSKCFEFLLYLGNLRGEGTHPAAPLLFSLLKNHIKSDFSPGVELKDIAAKFNVSPRTVNRMFAAYLNTTPAQYRRECRFRAACELLTMTDLSLKEIADHLGYCSQFHFSREFKHQAGMPPRQWKTEEKRRKTLPPADVPHGGGGREGEAKTLSPDAAPEELPTDEVAAK